MDPARLVLGDPCPKKDAPGSPKVYICQFIDIETKEKLKFAVWFEGILPEIYTPRHGVTLKSKLFCILIFVKIFFAVFCIPLPDIKKCTGQAYRLILGL